jgi:hypothetical protein
MKPLEALTANKWYPLQNGRPLYPTPQSILREAVGSEEYKFVCETVTTDHIRAAVIMPLDVPFQHLLVNEPWGMSYKSNDWRMLIVSTLDPTRWLTLARASGAKAWLKGHNMTVTYNWELPECDEHGLKLRPTNCAGDHRQPKGVSKPSTQIKSYDKLALIDDLRDRSLTYVKIAERHGLSRIRVMEIAKQEGLTRTKAST